MHSGCLLSACRDYLHFDRTYYDPIQHLFQNFPLYRNNYYFLPVHHVPIPTLTLSFALSLPDKLNESVSATVFISLKFTLPRYHKPKADVIFDFALLPFPPGSCYFVPACIQVRQDYMTMFVPDLYKCTSGCRPILPATGFLSYQQLQ